MFKIGDITYEFDDIGVVLQIFEDHSYYVFSLKESIVYVHNLGVGLLYRHEKLKNEQHL